MVKQTIECYEITAKIIIRKDYLDSDIDKKQNIKEVIKDRIQQGIEIPIEKIDLEITK